MAAVKTVVGSGIVGDGRPILARQSYAATGCPSERPRGCLPYRTPRRRQTEPVNYALYGPSERSCERPFATSHSSPGGTSKRASLSSSPIKRLRCPRRCVAVLAGLPGVGMLHGGRAPIRLRPPIGPAGDDSVQAVLAVQGSLTQLYFQEEVQGDRDARTPGTARTGRFNPAERLFIESGRDPDVLDGDRRDRLQCFQHDGILHRSRPMNEAVRPPFPQAEPKLPETTARAAGNDERP